MQRLSAFLPFSYAAAFLIATLALGASLPARAVGIGPSITVAVDGLEVLSLSCVNGLACDPLKGTATLPVSVDLAVAGEYSISLFATNLSENGTGIRLEPDPEIFYGSSVIDFGAPSTFSFVFQQGIVPTPAPGFASHDHASSTTDGSTANGVPVTALAPPTGIPTDATIDEIAVYTLSTNSGASWLNPGFDLSPSFTGAAGTSDNQGPFFESGAGPASAGAFYDAMRVDLNFSMNGNNDSYNFSGHATIVPEPQSALLLLFGLGLLGRRARVRR